MTETSSAIRSHVVWRAGPVSIAVGYGKFYSRLHDAVIRVYDDAGNVVETHEQKGDFKEP